MYNNNIIIIYYNHKIYYNTKNNHELFRRIKSVTIITVKTTITMDILTILTT